MKKFKGILHRVGYAPVLKTDIYPSRQIIDAKQDLSVVRDHLNHLQRKINLPQIHIGRTSPLAHCIRVWSSENINSNSGLNVSIGRKELGILNLRRSDIKHATGKPNAQGAIIYDQIRNINKLLQSDKTVFLGTSPDDGGHPEVSEWYYYEIKVGNNLNYINIKKMAGSGQFRFHSIADERGFDIGRISQLTDAGRRRVKK